MFKETAPKDLTIFCTCECSLLKVNIIITYVCNAYSHLKVNVFNYPQTVYTEHLWTYRGNALNKLTGVQEKMIKVRIRAE